MREEIVIRVSRRWILTAMAMMIGGIGTLLVSESLRAQDRQDKYSEKFDIMEKSGQLAITCSESGQYVFAIGENGIVVSNDYGQTGSWAQTIKLK